ncbi:neuroblast differentiation-associated protein AHNAK [Callorhinchus milii]|uniref:neuroblast differentiation-associated protein AHNAK n=1 Tax=Callorhinchus milii TaxID=7868 RepID=UPI001C3FD8C9|nr:neuroblast differentiation-associated protein AHNAK [Callorhinchus milii]
MSLIMNSDTEVIRPGKGEPLSSMLTLADADDGGVIIRDIKQDSDIAKASTLKKGDHIYGATIYFDNMNSGDVAQILKYSESCKAGLKLHSDGEITSPDSLKLRNFSLKSLDAGIGDQTYTDIYNKKIKKHLKLPTPNINAQNADPKAMKLQDPDIRGPSFGIPSLKEKGVDAEFKTPNVEMPSLNLRGPNISGPDGDLGFKVPNIKGVSPKLDGNFKSPTIDVKSPEVDLNVPDTNLTFWDKLKFPKFKKPNLGISEPDVKMPGLRLDTDLPETNIKLPSGKMKLPKVDAKIPKLDLKAPNLDIKAPKLDMKTPELDLKTPKLDVKTPKLDMDVNVPKIKTPTLKIPSLNLPGINTSKPDVNLSAPDLKAGFSGPQIDGDGLFQDINLSNAEGKFKIPDVSSPSLSIPDYKAKMPEINADLKSPKIDITPKGNLEGKSQKFKNLFKWSLPKASVPDVNMDLNKPDVNGQLSLPDPKFQGAIKGPNIDLEGKKFDMKAPSAEFQGPKFETPEMNLSPLKASLPDLNLPSLENARSNIKGLKIDGDLSNPKVKGSDFYVNLPKAGITMPDVDINMKAPKISGRDEELDLKSPQVKGNIDLPEPSIKGGVKLPTFNANVPGAGVDVKSSDLKFNDPSLSRISGGTFKVRSASVSDLDEPTNGSTNGLNLKAQSSSTLNINGDTKSKKSRFKLPSLGYKSRGSVDLNKAQVESSKSFGSRFNLPELEFSLTPTS